MNRRQDERLIIVETAIHRVLTKPNSIGRRGTINRASTFINKI
ncbi:MULTISPECIES: hypothetical protein [unclassified Nostoc]|nr:MULTISPECIES: hypothetical protein [unclassified Nostoc]